MKVGGVVWKVIDTPPPHDESGVSKSEHVSSAAFHIPIHSTPASAPQLPRDTAQKKKHKTEVSSEKMKDVSASVCFLSLILSCVVLSSNGFITPVSVTRSRAPGTNKALRESYRSRVNGRWKASMSAARGNLPSSG